MRLRSRRSRTVVAAAAVLMPARVRRLLHTRLLGYAIDPTARIGRSLIDVEEFRAGPGATVASLSVLRGCSRVTMGEGANIGALVWVNAVRRDSPTLRAGLERDAALVLDRGAGITSLHFIDCCDRVELHEFALISGLMSQVLTHSLDYRAGRQDCSPVEIGAYAVIGTKSLLLPGVVVGARSIVAGGSVLPEGKYPELTLVGGVPATARSTLDPGAGIFHRSGPVD